MRLIAISLVLLALSDALLAAEAAPSTDTAPAAEPTSMALEPDQYLVLPRVGDYARFALHADPIEGMLARGEWSEPEAGEVVTNAVGVQAEWALASDKFDPSLVGGYAYATFESPSEQTMLLSAPGVAAVWLNGEWIVGDPYSTGWFQPPVLISEGRNELLLHLARPDARVRFLPATTPLELLTQRAVLPNLVRGEVMEAYGSIPLRYSGDTPLTDHEVVAELEGHEPVVTALPRIAPRSHDFASFRIPYASDAEVGPLKLKVSLCPKAAERPDAEEEPSDQEESTADNTEALVSVEVTLDVVGPHDARVWTHVSQIDDTVQPYAVVPAHASDEDDEEGSRPPGVLLALHDAGKDYRSLLDHIPQSEGLCVIAPYGRGAYGFDWEGWSAQDAIEALDDFRSRVPTDPDRVSVVGRGMGGHGALVLATRHPARFAAVTALDAWNSIAARDVGKSPVAEALARRTQAEDPLSMLTNLAGARATILATNSGGNAAASQAFRRSLGEFHTDFTFRESADVTWNEVIELSQSTTARQREEYKVQFVTPATSVLSSLAWVTLHAQQRQGVETLVLVQRDLSARTISGTTSNAERISFAIDAFQPASGLTIRLDGQTVRVRWPRRSSTITLERDEQGRWRRAKRSPAYHKGPMRSGGLAEAFSNMPQLVYGTIGSEGEQRWAKAKARYDSDLFFYRGAGRLPTLPDRELDLELTKENNVVLYGNAKTNLAVRRLFADCPVWVSPGEVEVGLRPESGDDLGVLLAWPKRRSDQATVALIGGSGEAGMRLTTRLRYFWSGVSYPDLLLIGPRAIDPEPGDLPVDDARAAGYFGSDWSVENGDIVWRDLAL